MATLDRRQALKLLASLSAAGVAAPLLAACTSTTVQRTGQVTIGLIVPQSGPWQKIGAEMTAGFQVFLDLHNQTLGGVPAALLLIDEGGTSASAVGAVKAALQSGGVTALAGVASSDVLTAIRPTVETARVPLIGSNGSPDVQESGPEYIWQTAFVAGEAGTAMGGYLAGQRGLQRVAIYDDGSTDGASEVSRFSQMFTPAHQLALSAAGGQVSTADLRQIKNFNADAVFAACAGQAAVDFLAGYRDAKITAPLYGSGSLTEGWVLTDEKQTARSVYTTSNYAPDADNLVNQQFVYSYVNVPKTNEQTGQLPSVSAMAAYDAALVLDSAIKQITGTVTPGGLNAALGTTGVFDSPRGQWEFNQNRTPRQRWYLRQVDADGGTLSNTLVRPVATLT